MSDTYVTYYNNGKCMVLKRVQTRHEEPYYKFFCAMEDLNTARKLVRDLNKLEMDAMRESRDWSIV